MDQHSRRIQNACEICEKTFAFKISLVRHQHIHIDQYQTIYPICNTFVDNIDIYMKSEKISNVILKQEGGRHLIGLSRSVTEKSGEQVDLSVQFLLLRQAAH